MRFAKLYSYIANLFWVSDVAGVRPWFCVMDNQISEISTLSRRHVLTLCCGAV